MKKLTEKFIEMQSRMQSMLNDEKGATMVEYALMVALVAVICVTAVTALQVGISDTFTDAVTAL